MVQAEATGWPWVRRKLLGFPAPDHPTRRSSIGVLTLDHRRLFTCASSITAPGRQHRQHQNSFLSGMDSRGVNLLKFFFQNSQPEECFCLRLIREDIRFCWTYCNHSACAARAELRNGSPRNRKNHSTFRHHVAIFRTVDRSL